MIHSVKNADGYIVSYLECYQVDKSNRLDYNGEYLYIVDIWTHENIRKLNCVDYYIQKVIPMFPECKWVYWVRGKYNGRMSFYGILRGNTIKLKKERYQNG